MIDVLQIDVNAEELELEEVQHVFLHPMQGNQAFHKTYCNFVTIIIK